MVVRVRRRSWRVAWRRPSSADHACRGAGLARVAEIAGVERKIHFFAMDLPHSDACFVQAYPEETTEAFCDAHNGAFGFFGKCRTRYSTTIASWRWRASWVRGAPAHADIQ